MRRQRPARGQSVVELALSMLVIVPTFMYILFLDDLLRAKLDLEEAVMTAPWEYARVDFEQGGAGKGLRSAVRLGWCDHTTAYNSYDRPYDCTSPVHHVAMSAHQCWLTEGAKQVSCTVDPAFGKLDGTLTAGPFHDQYTKGGLVRCSARLGVINYFLPQKMFSEFSQADITDTKNKKGSSSVHAAGKDLAIEDHILLEEQVSGLVVDSWALGKMEKIGPTDKGNLQERTQKVYGTYGGLGFVMGINYYMKMLQMDVVNPSLIADGMGDSPFDANIAFDPDNGTFNEDMHGSPHAFERGTRYMGDTKQPGE